MSRAEERARRDRLKAKAESAQRAEAAALESFVPTPRPTVLARAVQRVLGAPALDDPIHGHRANVLAQLQEALDHGTPPDQDGATPSSNGQR